MSKPPLKILLELRPTLDGHAGIPQATRLLFRSLSKVDGFSVEGLIQSGSHALGRGLPTGRRALLNPLSKDQQLNRLARIVIMMEQKFWYSYLTAVPMVLRHLLGGTEDLTRFEA